MPECSELYIFLKHSVFMVSYQQIMADDSVSEGFFGIRIRPVTAYSEYAL
jgi:hypothetical protein